MVHLLKNCGSRSAVTIEPEPTSVPVGEKILKENMLNPPETFLLTSLYINGYGVDKDTSCTSKWLFHAWGVDHPLSAAYGYRIARATGITFDNTESVVASLKLMALRDSRTALEDLAIVSKDEYKETTKIIRTGLSGTGASHSSEEEMPHGFRYGMWIKTFENIPIILENFSRLPHIADYTINKRGDRILHMAVSCGQTEAIEALLNRFLSLTVNQLNKQGACRAGQSRTVLWLTSHGATALIGARNGESPLHWLIPFDDEEVERVYPGLIQPGADTTAKTSTIIAYQADFPAAAVPDRLPRATHCDRPQIVPSLLSNIADPRICNERWPQANTALRVGASQLRSECLELMMHAMEQYIVEHERAGSRDFLVAELLEQAVHGSSLFDMILYHGPKNQQAMESTFNCLLPRASRITYGAYGGFKQTLLYFDVSLARDELVEYLVKHGADVIKARTDHDEEAIESQDVGTFKRADINRASGVNMRTPLLEAVRWNRPALVNLLLEHGAQATKASKNPFSGQDSTWTALHILAYAGQDATRLVQQPLDHGAALNGLPDHFHTTESPLLIAVLNDAFHLAHSLVSHGADLNFTTLSCGHLTLSNPTTILGHVIASNARNSIARLCYLLGSASMRDGLHFIVEPARQWTALHRAAAAHIDVEFRGTDATEAAELHWADVDWSAGRESMNEILRHFNKPEQLNAVETSTGLTPMHLAVLAGNEAAVSLLLDHGARSDVPSVGGQGATADDTGLGIQMGGGYL
ncbi:hypothetical protein FOIG_15256 [Fusarium odoratissimum NRRL 54006]|uniref:Ankyrin n=1 Tax=Fusarium odoratissimum (strain NRRL 54006) TaxID=1089451 RepID=X0K3H0_FUSO5|nr:uncharacterized protein FOIG_15256 [Fusarium odoratissimum NRRL 54006]EXL91604.1 hypothetical protein FOIG_15256 [Fusarium odoratissimum NRRL 54006]